MHKYDDIINLEHHVSSKHEAMSMYARAAQFAPFAALVGYDEQVKESARLTDKKIEIDEGLKALLDNKIQLIKSKMNDKVEITITYFVKDNKKDGGVYKDITGIVNKIDTYKQLIIINDEKINVNDIINITGDIFKGY